MRKQLCLRETAKYLGISINVENVYKQGRYSMCQIILEEGARKGDVEKEVAALTKMNTRFTKDAVKDATELITSRNIIKQPNTSRKIITV